MNFDNLNAEIARCRLTIPILANKMGVSKKTLYSRMRGETNFRQNEISAMSKILNLDGEQIIDIFFANLVS